MKKKLDRATLIQIIGIAVFILVSIGIAIWAIPYIKNLGDPAVREFYKQKIDQMGIGGFFVILGVQVLQVVVAVIPGEPVELLSGLLFGGIWGLVVCLIGILIGTVIIYYLVKKFGKPLVDMFVPGQVFEKWKFLQDARKLETIFFVLFIIPGTPKDLLTYLAPLTMIRPGVFFMIATLARIPAIVTSTFAGASIYHENFVFTGIMLAVAILLAFVGIFANKKIMAFIDKQKERYHTGRQSRRKKK